MTDQPAAEGAEALTHTPEELLARYLKAMGGRPVATLEIDEYSAERIIARAEFEDGHTRPGGMVAGPILFTLADTMGYFVTISLTEGLRGFHGLHLDGVLETRTGRGLGGGGQAPPVR